MKQVLMGHRGVGKSTFIKALPNENKFDLDEEIEKVYGKKISEFFVQEGEEKFRDLEKKVFSTLIANKIDYIISLGAGFPVETLSKDIEKIWIKRNSDSLGRIFLDRPRLENHLSPIAEYKKRYTERNIKFEKVCDRVVLLPEGHFNSPASWAENANDNGVLCILPEHLKSDFSVKYLQSLPLKYFEVRDDLLADKEIEKCFSVLPNSKILFSCRNERREHKKWLSLAARSDWDIKLSPRRTDILSVHGQGSFDALVRQFKGEFEHAKIAHKTNSLAEVIKGIEWQQLDPTHRNFFPMSEDGRWNWVRRYLKGKQAINFIRDNEGSAPDQPTFWQWKNTPVKFSKFAAVLGSPISHSYSPSFHSSFFAKKDMPFLAIEIEESEWDEYLPKLIKLGLVAAAVTSPLKNKISANNTLAVRSGDLVTTTTDEFGFKEIIKDLDQNASMVVWGGGGVLPAIKSVLPKVSFYSVKNKCPRDGSMPVDNPEVLIWAAGFDANLPLPKWRPKVVVDLNYREDSVAREYALTVGAKYTSGLAMFIKQAEEQQKFWEKHL